MYKRQNDRKDRVNKLSTHLLMPIMVQLINLKVIKCNKNNLFNMYTRHTTQKYTGEVSGF